MQFDISRDFLDRIIVTHPAPQEGQGEVKINGGLHFLPSSPDGKLHTVIAHFAIGLEGQEQPFAQGGWRFLFTSSEKFDPQENPNHEFLRSLLVIGTSKIMTIANGLFMQANMPIIPVDPNAMAQASHAVTRPESGDAPETAES